MFDSPVLFPLHQYGRPGDLDLVVGSAQRTEAALVDLESDRLDEAHEL